MSDVRRAVNDELSIASACVGCGRPMDSDLPSWMATVNLTPDAVFIERLAAEFGEALVEVDVAFDWCDVACFGRWLFRMAAESGAKARLR